MNAYLAMVITFGLLFLLMAFTEWLDRWRDQQRRRSHDCARCATSNSQKDLG